MYSHVIVHYAEIGTKKGNRPYFEKCLAKNIRRKIDGIQLRRSYGRLVIELDNKSDIEKIHIALSSTFGVANFSFAVKAELNLDDIMAKTLEIAKRSDAATFRITTKRANKSFPLTSIQVNEIVAGPVMDLGKKVDLKDAELVLSIEITNKSAYVYDSAIRGLGGLPVGSAGRVISLVSGGIDSPVASYLAMKRGCKCSLIHFHNYTLYQESVKKKIIGLAEKLATYNGHTRLIIVPFADIQKEIIGKVPSEYRMLAYRRAMLRIAEKFRIDIGAKAYVTGDCIGQVASQTLDNLDVIYSAAEKPIIAPLIGYDKQEIIEIAKKIGTYDTSILPYNDCCSAFVTEHPATKAKKEELEEMEKGIDFEKIITEAIRNTEILDI